MFIQRYQQNMQHSKFSLVLSRSEFVCQPRNILERVDQMTREFLQRGLMARPVASQPHPDAVESKVDKSISFKGRRY